MSIIKTNCIYCNKKMEIESDTPNSFAFAHCGNCEFETDEQTDEDAKGKLSDEDVNRQESPA